MSARDEPALNLPAPPSRLPGEGATPVLLATGLALLVAGTALHLSGLDAPWMLALSAGRAATWVQVLWSSLTVAGFGWSCVILLLAADRRDGALVALLLPVLAVTGLVTHALKGVLGTTRPAGSAIGEQLVVIGERIQGIGSTPSGHALAAAATATLLLLWFGRRSAAWVLPAGLLVAVSRVPVGAHWPSDVTLGIALGILSVLAVTRAAGRPSLAPRWERLRARSATPRGQRWVAFLEVLAVAGLVATPTGYPLGWPMEVALVALGLGSAVARVRHAQRLRRAAGRGTGEGA